VFHLPGGLSDIGHLTWSSRGESDAGLGDTARAHTEHGGAGLWGSLRCSSCCQALPAARRTLAGDAMAGCCDQ